MIGIGVIGYGYWGPNLVRNFSDLPNARVAGVCDLSADRLRVVQQRYPNIYTTCNHRELLKRPDVDAVVIATPVSSHFSLAMEALRAGKHVLVEKPLAASSDQALRMIDEAQRQNRILLVDHTFLYSGAVRKIRELIDQGELGHIYYYDSVRVNLGLFQPDVSVLWDLAVHDLSLVDHLLGGKPHAVSATGISHLPRRPENMAYLTLFFSSTQVAHIHVNWLAPVKIRRTLIGGSRKMIVYDDLEPSEKVKIYDKGVQFGASAEPVQEAPFVYRVGDMWAPHLDSTEALKREAAYFVKSIEDGQETIAESEAGLRVIQILEAATRSMALYGQPVELNLNKRMAA